MGWSTSIILVALVVAWWIAIVAIVMVAWSIVAGVTIVIARVPVVVEYVPLGWIVTAVAAVVHASKECH